VTAALFALLLLALGGVCLYEVGREAGRREQRQIVNCSLDAIRQQGLAAQRHIDYLYEQAEQRIEDANEQGDSR
jgi:hypothetical protein